MRRVSAVAGAVALSVLLVAAQSSTGKPLAIYVIDVEGGNATLFAAPSGESVLIDSGNAGSAAVRDADRIMAAVKDAGLKQIDTLITTHWHNDHMGAMAELAGRIPIRHFVDHGPNVQPAATVDEFLAKTYPVLYGKARHTVAKAGDTIPMTGVDWRIVTSARDFIKSPLPGAGQPNPHCAGFKPHAVNPVTGQPLGNTEDEHSVGSHVTFGRFRFLYLADFPWNKEFELMCPVNRLGTIELYLVSRHGQHSSNSTAFVHALRPRVAIINNGTRKGGQPETMRVLHSAPGLEDIWQLHFSLLSGQEYSVPGMFIANVVDDQPAAMPVAPMVATPGATGLPPVPQHNGPSHWIKISAQPNGTFSVTNTRNGFSKTYEESRK
jgi:competence protein ComEC